MPRQARIVVPSGIYHVLCRGNNRQTIFHADSDRERFLSLLSRYKKRYTLDIFHYELMDNHVHLIVQSTRETALSRGMHGLDLTYAQHFRAKYGGIGHFWQDRFKSFLMEKESYLFECGRYVELNSTRAGKFRDPGDDPWSSFRYYANGQADSLITENPLYHEMGRTVEERREVYRTFVLEGLKERRGLERYFRQKICGSHDYVKTILETAGLPIPKIRPGRPSKKPRSNP